MGMLLMILGLIWAAVGVFAIVIIAMSSTSTGDAVGITVFFNLVVFIVPGLVVGAIGQIARNSGRNRNSDRAQRVAAFFQEANADKTDRS